jgi:hypothetical protein
MWQQKNEPNPAPENDPDLFDEPRDHANQWDISGLWTPEGPQPRENPSGPVVE